MQAQVRDTSTTNNILHPRMVTFGGYAMIVFALLFVGLTLVIDLLSTQQMLRYSMEQHGLFNVAYGSSLINFLLSVYALSPLLIIPAAVGTCYLFGDRYSPEMRVGMAFAVIAAAALCLSMLMLPSFNWLFSTQIPNLTDQSQNLALIIMKSMHSYFGIYVGDMLGIGCLLVWLLICSVIGLRSFIVPRSIAWACLILTCLLALVLFLRYTNIWPDLFYNIRVGALIGLWFVMFGAAMVSVGKDLY